MYYSLIENLLSTPDEDSTSSYLQFIGVEIRFLNSLHENYELIIKERNKVHDLIKYLNQIGLKCQSFEFYVDSNRFPQKHLFWKAGEKVYKLGVAFSNYKTNEKDALIIALNMHFPTGFDKFLTNKSAVLRASEACPYVLRLCQARDEEAFNERQIRELTKFFESKGITCKDSAYDTTIQLYRLGIYFPQFNTRIELNNAVMNLYPHLRLRDIASSSDWEYGALQELNVQSFDDIDEFSQFQQLCQRFQEININLPLNQKSSIKHTYNSSDKRTRSEHPFIRYLPETKQTFINLNHNRMDPAGVKNFLTQALHFKYCPRSLEINLESNYLDVSGAEFISNIFNVSNYAVKLKLSLFNNRFSAKGAEYLSRILSAKYCPKELELSLTHNHLGTEGARYFAEMLATGECHENIHLGLADNDFTIKAITHFASSIQSKKWPNFLTLNLGYNRLGPKEIKVLADALISSANCPEDFTLDFSNNIIGDEGIDSVLTMLQSPYPPKRFTLNIGYNGFTAEGIANLLNPENAKFYPQDLTLIFPNKNLNPNFAVMLASLLSSQNYPINLTIDVRGHLENTCFSMDDLQIIAKAMLNNELKDGFCLKLADHQMAYIKHYLLDTITQNMPSFSPLQALFALKALYQLFPKGQLEPSISESDIPPGLIDLVVTCQLSAVKMKDDAMDIDNDPPSMSL